MQKFVMLPGELYEKQLDFAEFGVYSALLMFMGRKTHQSTPSVATVAKLFSCSENTVRKALKSLAEKGLITVSGRVTEQGRSTSNCYTLTLYSEGYDRVESAESEAYHSSSLDYGDDFLLAAAKRTMLEGV